MTIIKRKIKVLPWQNPYITNGLIGMWDGEWNVGPDRHDTTATGLADLAGINNFNGAADCIVSDKAFCFSDSRYQAFWPEDILSAVGGGRSYTVELFHTPRNVGGSTLLFSRPESHNIVISSLWGEKKSYQIRNFAVHNDPTRTDDSGFYGAIVHKHPHDMVFLNGQLMKTATSDIEPPPTRIYFFRDFIHCLRIYNRGLSDDEIAANYAIDRVRFL
jgi:hypothetical protein